MSKVLWAGVSECLSRQAGRTTGRQIGGLQAISKGNPLSYEVNALRGLLIGLPTNLALDFGVLAGATTAAITVASLLLPRLAR